MPLTDKQKKLIYAGIGVYALIHFVPFIAERARASFAPSVASYKPSPAVPTNLPVYHLVPQNPGIVTQAERELALSNRLVGIWHGAGIVPSRGVCQLTLEIKPNPQMTETFHGFSTFACGPSNPFNGQHVIADSEQRAAQQIANMQPVSTVLDGAIKDNAMAFSVEQSIGTPPDCPLTAMRVLPFGDSSVAAVWQSATTCQGGGSMVLQKTTQR